MTARRRHKLVTWTLLLLLAAASRAEAVAAQTSNKVDAWFDAQWQYRMLIGAKSSEVEGSGTFANFPMLVRLNAANHASIFAAAKADGSDLRFTLRNGSLLNHELVSYDGSAQTAQIWVRMGALSKTQNELYVYYGNPTASSTSSSSVWSNYTAVYHFEQNPASGSLTDSSPNGHSGATRVANGVTWSAADRMSGQIGSAWQYDTDKTVVNQSIVLTQKSWTVSAWVNLDTRGTDFVLQGGPCFFFLAPQASNISWDTQYKNDYCPSGGIDHRYRSGQTAIQTWDYYAWSMDESDSTVTVYHDGVAYDASWIWPNGEKVIPHGLGNGNEPLGIGSTMYAQNLGDSMHGRVDELRIRAGVATPDWMLTEYRNQSDPLAFFVFGPAEERVAVPRRSLGSLKVDF